MSNEAPLPAHGPASGRGDQVDRLVTLPTGQPAEGQMFGGIVLGSMTSALHDSDEDNPPHIQSGHENGISLRDVANDTIGGRWLHPSPLSRYRQPCEISSCDGVESVAGEHPDTSLAKQAIEELRMKPVPGGRAQSTDATDSDVFLVTERDIQSIIEASISRSGTGALIKRDGSVVDLDEQRNCIRPRPSEVLDPATTISVPQTSFAQSTYDAGDRPVTATVVSRRSTSEITWVKKGSQSVDDLTNSDKDPDGAVSHNPDHASCRQSWASSRPDPLTGHCSPKSPKRTGYSIHDRISGNVIHHTPEAATPAASPTMPSPGSHSPHRALQRISAPRDRTVSLDLYDHGIDAHCGTSSHGHTLFTEEAMQRRWTSNRCGIPSHSNGETWLVRRSTLALPHLTPTRGCGNLIGFSPPPRRQSVPGLGAERGRGRTASARASLMDSVLGIGRRLVGGLDRAEPGEWALDPNNSPAGSAGEYNFKSRATSVSSVRVRWDDRERACFEDGRPHACENDLDEEAAR